MLGSGICPDAFIVGIAAISTLVTLLALASKDPEARVADFVNRPKVRHSHNNNFRCVGLLYSCVSIEY